MKENIIQKEEFNIKDLAKIVNKQTQTVRSWEKKGIISKPENKYENGWRKYTKEDLADALDSILKYNWERKVIKNESEIEFIISYLRGNGEINNLSLIQEVENE